MWKRKQMLSLLYNLRKQTKKTTRCKHKFIYERALSNRVAVVKSKLTKYIKNNLSFVNNKRAQIWISYNLVKLNT